MCGTSACGDARAVVAHRQLAVAAARTSIGAPGGLHLAALSSRFAIARSRLAGGRRRRSSARARRRPRRPGGCGCVRRIASSATRSSRTSSSPALCSSPRASSVSSLDQRGHLAELRDHVVEQLGAVLGGRRAAVREHLDVRAQARQRRAQLVRGVLDEPPLALGRVVERGEHLVEGRRELARARRCPPTLIRWLRSRVARTRSAVSLRSRTGRSVERATRKPGARGDARRRRARRGTARAGSARARGRRRRARRRPGSRSAGRAGAAGARADLGRVVKTRVSWPWSSVS